MKKAKKVLCLVMAVIMSLTAMAGCSSGEKPKEESTSGDATVVKTEGQTDIDLSKPVELSMYLIGSSSTAYEKAVGELNKRLKEDMNTTIKVSWIGWGDFGTKYPLVLASGEPIDLIYASGWCNFKTQAQKGAFMPLEELAPKYAPKSYAELTPEFLQQATIDDHMYGFPPTFFQYNCMGYIVRGDLMKKYGMTEIKGLDDYGKYLDNVVKNDPQFDPSGFMTTSDGLAPTYAGELGWYNISQTITSPYYFDFHDKDAKIFNYLDTPEMEAFIVKMKDWGDKGYWPKSVLSNKDEEMMANGKAASRIAGLDSWKGMAIKNPEFDVKWFPARPYVFKTEAMQDGMAVPASSKNPERALMFLEKLRQEEEYYDFLTYGIKGETYDITEDNKLQALDMENFAPENFCSWGFKSLKFFKEPVGTPDELKDITAKLAEKCEDNIYLAFSANLDPIKNEYAAVENVIQQYAIPLYYGYVDDPIAGIKELREKLAAAGSDKVLKELQTQLDAFLAARK